MGNNYSKHEFEIYNKYFPLLELIIQNEIDITKIKQKILKDVLDDKINFLEKIIIDYIKNNLKQKNQSDEKKFNLVLLLKEVIDLGDYKYIFYLEKKLWNRLFKICKKENSHKPYVYFILELIDEWGENFGKISNLETKFETIKNKLKSYIPTERKYSQSKYDLNSEDSNKDFNSNSKIKSNFKSFNESENKIVDDNKELVFYEKVDFYEKFLESINLIILEKGYWSYSKFKNLIIDFSEEYQNFKTNFLDDLINTKNYNKFIIYFNKIENYLDKNYQLINKYCKKPIYEEIIEEYLKIYKKIFNIRLFRIDNNSLYNSKLTEINDMEFLDIQKYYENANLKKLKEEENKNKNKNDSNYYINFIKMLVEILIKENESKENKFNNIKNEMKNQLIKLKIYKDKEYNNLKEVYNFLIFLENQKNSNINLAELQNNIKKKLENRNLQFSLIQFYKNDTNNLCKSLL